MLKKVNWKVFGIVLLYIALGLGFFYLSTKMTVKIMTFNINRGNEKDEYDTMMYMAILLESSKVLFTAKAILDKRINIVIRIVMVIISVALLLASIIANVGHIQNKANKVANEQIKNSAQYKQLEDGQSRQKDLYGSKQNEITNITASFNSRIEEMKKIKNSYGKDYITKKENIQKEINELEAEKTVALSKLNNDLSSINSNISPISTQNISVEAENGYIAVFEWISTTRVSKFFFRDADAEKLQGYFFVMIGSVFEIINMILFYLLSVYLKSNKILQNQKSLTPDPSPKQKVPNPEPKLSENSPKLNLLKSKQTLSLKAYKDSKLKDNDKLSDADIKKYLAYVSEYCKGNNTNIVPGYQNVSKQLKTNDGEQMGETRVRKIVAWLEQEGILKKENGRFILDRKEKVG